MKANTTGGDGRFVARKFSDIAQDLIRERILAGEYAPGERINEIALSESLQISRSPVREGLRELSAEGLVQMVPGRGAYVTSLTLEMVMQLGEVRMALECAIARTAAERADDGDIERLEAKVAEIEESMSDPNTSYPYQINFHEALGLAAKNPRLVNATDEIERQLRLARVTAAHGPERARMVLVEHRAIADAVALRDPEQAERAMRVHIVASTQAIASLLISD